MKILKIFGIVVGIHVFALVVIFANPGCSTTSKAPPAPVDTVAKAEPPPAVSVPNAAPAGPSGVYTSPMEPPPVSPAPITFDPNATAAAASPGSAPGVVRFTPTRPGTPVAGTLVAEKVVDVTPATTYVVKPGDSLWTIAKKHKLTVADLTQANGMAANANLQPGKKLVIPGKSLPEAAAAPAAASRKSSEAAPTARAGGETVKHVVKSGETLGIIARNYGVRQSDIAVANRISDPAKIQAGLELVIPGWQGSAGKSGKGSAKAATGAGAKPADATADPKVESASTPATPPVVTPPLIPIIRIDDTPVTPAPKP